MDQIVIKEIFELFETFGDQSYGEEVTQLEHMYQSALLAEKEGYDEEVIIAAFLHDIGHLVAQRSKVLPTGTYGHRSHDRIGADYLRELGFSEKVAALVEGHVKAKRYLTLIKPDYYEKLSEASKHTLALQGGKMTEQEALLFENSPWFRLSIKMRYWDEEAKIPNMPVGDLGRFRTMIEKHLEIIKAKNKE